MILLIDNYDSFTFNIYQMIASKTQVVVFRNDKVTIETIQKLNPAGIIISPAHNTNLKSFVISFPHQVSILIQGEIEFHIFLAHHSKLT